MNIAIDSDHGGFANAKQKAIAIGSDHGGFALKKELTPFIESMGYAVTDFGCPDETSVDYPDVAFALAEAVARGEFERGILICGTGIGVSICANRVRGVRCALCTDETMARLTREHNDSNVLALGARIIGGELAKGVVKAWLSTEFSGAARHAGRIDKISRYGC